MIICCSESFCSMERLAAMLNMKGYWQKENLSHMDLQLAGNSHRDCLHDTYTYRHTQIQTQTQTHRHRHTHTHKHTKQQQQKNKAKGTRYKGRQKKSETSQQAGRRTETRQRNIKRKFTLQTQSVNHCLENSFTWSFFSLKNRQATNS